MCSFHELRIQFNILYKTENNTKHLQYNFFNPFTPESF